MPKKQYSVEQIIVKLREIEILCGRGQTVAEAVRQAEITEQTYYRWRKRYGGMGSGEAQKMRLLENENARLKKIIAEQALDIAILKDVNSKNF